MILYAINHVRLCELILLTWIGQNLGLLPTVGIILLTGIVGAFLARLEGWRTMRQLRGELAAGRLPGEVLVQGAMILVAGAMLVTPGILTDTFGFCVLIPPVRRALAIILIRYFRNRFEIIDVNSEGSTGRRHVHSRVRTVNEKADC